MNSLVTILGTVVGFIGACAATDIVHVVITKNAAFEDAKRLSNGKGIINIGAGPHRTLQAQIIAKQLEVLGNVDIAPNGMPHFIQLDVERETLPFADKQFGCTFASHVLEHLDNWQVALGEMVRVADYVVVVLPHPTSFAGWLAPEHKQHFSLGDIQEIVELYPSVRCIADGETWGEKEEPG